MRRIWTKNVRALFILAVVSLFTACKTELLDLPEQPQEVGFYVPAAQTRTEMLSDGLKAKWMNDDQIALWAKNSSGSYVFSNQTFTMYGIDEGQGFFTSTLASAMPEDEYTYYACYPKPLSVDGTKVTFNLPAEQDGKVSGGADIMIAEPSDYGPLGPLPEEDDGKGFTLKMKHMLHQFRFYVPEGTGLGDDHIRRFQLTFPKPVVGDVTLDVTDPYAEPVLKNGSNVVTVNLNDVLVQTDENDRRYACVAIFPTEFEEGAVVEIKAYASKKMAKIEPIVLEKKDKTRDFKAGHSTAVKFDVKGLVDFAGVFRFTVKANNLGEAPNTVEFTAPTGCKWGDKGSDKLVYNPKKKVEVGDVVEVVFETDVDAYKNFSGKNITVKYDSDNAITTEILTVPSISASGKSDIPITVPYLFFEDFSDTKLFNNNGNLSATSHSAETIEGTDYGLPGWTGNQIALIESDNNRALAIRHQNECSSFLGKWQGTYRGRADSAPILSIRKDVSVNVKVTFSYSGFANGSVAPQLTYGFTVNNLDPISGYWASGSSAIDGGTMIANIINTKDAVLDGSISDFESENGKSTDFIIDECTNKHRLSWDCYAPYDSKYTASFGRNTQQWVFIDNIKVQIAN